MPVTVSLASADTVDPHGWIGASLVNGHGLRFMCCRAPKQPPGAGEIASLFTILLTLAPDSPFLNGGDAL